MKISIRQAQGKRSAAVYDRWLFTLGGGEQVAFAYAMSLRDLGYKTSILTHQRVNIEKAVSKMGVDLHNISIEYLPQMASKKLSQYSEKYDVFINTSYLDYFPNRSKFGILSIFFPSQIFLTPYEYIKRALILPSFSRFFIYPSTFEGFVFDEYKNHVIYKWLGDRSSILFNRDIKHFSITLYFRKLGVAAIDTLSFLVGEEEVEPIHKAIGDSKNLVTYYFEVHATAGKKFSISRPDGQSTNEIALIRLTIQSWRYILYNWFKRIFPKWEMRLHGGPGVTKLSDITTYQKLLTISAFSQKWIKKYWGLDSEILYPPVSTSNFHVSANKKNWITHVGRFFVTGHCKKQLDLVKAFRKLVDQSGRRDWELHFVGSVHDGDKHREYFEQVKYYATGYPVFFHMDAPFSELQEILSKSKIYWHATGLDENEERSPILFEHFGITTVEAMASGCVPVVINAGGQKEIVTSGSGFLWDTRQDLIEKTLLLMQNEKKLIQMRNSAVKRSAYFSTSEFRKRFASLLP
ncbi:MAG TPA: glycosyltransferase [Patescibacteria group bacterium]|nr:glycosyltransferase [Patescibacteria group bacterium]